MAAKSAPPKPWIRGNVGCLVLILFLLILVFACGVTFDLISWPVLDNTSSTQVQPLTMPDCGAKRVWAHFDNHGNIIAYTCGE